MTKFMERSRTCSFKLSETDTLLAMAQYIAVIITTIIASLLVFWFG